MHGVKRIVILNSIKESTIHIPAGSEVEEIVIIGIELRDEGAARTVVDEIAKASKHKPAFLCREPSGRASLAVRARGVKFGSWMHPDELTLKVPGDTLDYTNRTVLMLQLCLWVSYTSLKAMHWITDLLARLLDEPSLAKSEAFVTEVESCVQTPVAEFAHPLLLGAGAQQRGQRRSHAVGHARTLFDAGYLTIDYDRAGEPRVVVSGRLHEDFGNGRDCYPYHGRRLAVVPDRKSLRPARQYPGRHHDNVLLG